MTDTVSYDAVIKSLRMMKRVRNLHGAILIHEGIPLGGDTILTDAGNDGFVREVNALSSLYRNSREKVCRVLVEFDGGNIMIFLSDPFALALFFGSGVASEKVEKYGEEFLEKWADALQLEDSELSLPHITEEGLKETNILDDEESAEVTDDHEESVEEETEPDSEVDAGALWDDFRVRTENLFSKVLGRAQAKRFIERELTALGVEKGNHLSVSQFRPFGERLIKRVKDRTVKKQLELELVSLVGEFTK